MTKKYKIEFNKKCLKDLKKIPPVFRNQIQEKVGQLAGNPRLEGFKKLQGSKKIPLYRVRCGDYRIVYVVNDDVLLILILEIGHRSTIYRNF
ncbi:MAG: mRNA interferase RelE [Chlamydiae bacterium]|nr:mRNA interferase RelE [Chlamydiota bacterium]